MRNGAGSVDAAAGAYIHLDEHMVHRLYVLQHVGNTVCTVHRHIPVSFRQGIKRTYDALRGRISFGAVGNGFLVTHRQPVHVFNVNIVLLQELNQFIKGDDGIDGMFVSLAFFGNAGADENHFELRIVTAQHFSVCHHGRVNRGEIWECFGVIHLYQTAGCRTGRGDEVPHVAFG